MKQRNSLFGRIFSLVGVTLLLSAILTLCIYIGISNKIYVSSKTNELLSIGKSVSNLLGGEEEISITKLKTILDSNMNFADTKIEVYDKDGNSYMLNYRQDIFFEDKKANQAHVSIKDTIKNKRVMDVLSIALTGEEYCLETDNYIFVGLPIYDDDNNIIAAVVLTRQTPIMDYASNMSLYLTLIISTLGVFLIMLLPAYLITRRIVRPLRQMTGVANAMSKGDFSLRVDENLDGEIGVLARAINTCAKESEKLETTRRDYVANVSHELRTPISSMRVMGETLKDGLVQDEEKRQKYYDNIVKESIRLSNLVNDLLELSRIQSNSYEISKEYFNINEVLESIKDIYSNINNKDIDFSVDFDKDIKVYSNAEKIEEILIILIDNAIKHTKKGSIKVYISDEKDKIKVNVSDTGCGISKEDCAHIFDRFYKVDKSHSSEGSGLGLSIAQEILKNMNEEIGVDSILDEGSTFWFTIHKKH